MRSREPLNSTVEPTTRRQNGQSDGATRSRWHDRHADLLNLDETDIGYRLLVAEL